MACPARQVRPSGSDAAATAAHAPSRAATMPWAATAADVAGWWGVDVTHGLDLDEVVRRRQRYGPNELPPESAPATWRRIARQFRDPLVMLLLAAIAISALAWWWDGADGFPAEPAVIVAIVALNAGLSAWQEMRAERALAALREMTVATVAAWRDGRTATVPASDLVPGDVLVLSAGDSVGADCRLVESASLAIIEGSLTGESEPVAKQVDGLPPDTLLAERSNMVFQGTAIATGRGVGIVTATGLDTELGRIAGMLGTADVAPTPLEQQIRWLGRVLGLAVVVIATVVVVVILVTSQRHGFSDLVEAALVGVSLAVAAVPEGLPAILSIVLGLGVRRMAGDQAIVKQLSSVETLGCASVICSDKTGTLTRNEMTVTAVAVGADRVDAIDRLDVIGAELVADGRPAARGTVDVVRMLLAAGQVASDAAVGSANGRSTIQGDPTEAAVVRAAHDLDAAAQAVVWERFAEIPFDADRRMMSTLCRATGPTELEGDVLMFTKGAPDVVLGRCDRVRAHGTIQPMDDDGIAAWARAVDELADDGLRTLAIAYRPLADPLDRSESGLILLGLVGIVDPPREEARAAVAEARRGGVRVVMVTGDHPRTASRIARRLDIDAADRVLTGREMADLDDSALIEATRSIGVYARVEPADKLRLVRAMQAAGEITAMTGDGVNDGPALRQADIGVAMGRGGTEVAREAADMVLADDNVATIVRAIREGREIYADITKFLRYLLASNTGEVLVVVLGVLAAGALGLTRADQLAVPLLATQILWINLVTDGALALALGVDPAVDDVMLDRPRPSGARLIDAAMLRTIVIVGTATAAVSLIALDLELSGGLLGGDGDITSARTMAFTTLVLAQVFNALSCRSDRASVGRRLFASPLLWLAIVATVAAQVAVVHVPGLNDAFDATPLDATQWATCTGLASAVLVVTELTKAVTRHRMAATPTHRAR